MFSHRQIWSAIDRLADYHDLSPSGLARRAGLDPTTFNKSKRFAKDGRARWPSTESLAKILSVTGTSFETFHGFLSSAPQKLGDMAAFGQRGSVVPVLGFAEAGVGGFFDDGGFPVGHGWEEVELPNMKVDGAYALKISGDSMMPVYRDGDIILVSTVEKPLPGDRVVVRTVDGEVMAKVLVSADPDTVKLMSLNVSHPGRTLETKEVEWLARITWASQ